VASVINCGPSYIRCLHTAYAFNENFIKNNQSKYQKNSFIGAVFTKRSKMLFILWIKRSNTIFPIGFLLWYVLNGVTVFTERLLRYSAVNGVFAALISFRCNFTKLRVIFCFEIPWNSAKFRRILTYLSMRHSAFRSMNVLVHERTCT